MFIRGSAIAAVSALLLALTVQIAFAAETRVAPLPDASASPSPAAAATPEVTPKPERFSVHAQLTNTQQYHGAFSAAYSGPMSLAPQADTAKTVDATVFFGVRIASNTEFYVNPEVDQGFGLGQPRPPGKSYFGTAGIAGFPSGEAYKVGSYSSYGRIMRTFVRQTINLGGGDLQAVDPDINQLGGSIDPAHIIVTAGKFSVVDVFDTNPYAHDTKHDFLNWTIIDMGAFDYAADAWGYTYGASAEWTAAHSTLRVGLFQLSKVPNQIAIENAPFDEYSSVIEYEKPTSFLGRHPGSIKGLVYADIGYMGPYADAVSAALIADSLPNTADVRTSKHIKTGTGINIAQEIAPNIGVFARLSAMNGTYEAYEFTDVDSSMSTGLSIDGHLYHRQDDSFGIAGAFNNLSAPARQYFADGGIGILVGDGSLSYGGERILETYYSLGITKDFGLTLDYQYVKNPAYNVVRGPVSVYTLRYHAQI
jgi:high affinity Mn2+ porin